MSRDSSEQPSHHGDDAANDKEKDNLQHQALSAKVANADRASSNALAF